MHEMSLAESVREIVDETARANGARRVAAVRLEIGKLAQVEIDAMRFAFDVVTRGLARRRRRGSRSSRAMAAPGACAARESVAIARRGDACPKCGSYQLQVTGGDRMRVMDIEVE